MHLTSKMMSAPWVARHHVLGEQHQQAIWVDDGAGIGHHADAITVAVEGQADIGVFAFHFGDQVDQVLRFAGIWMVIGEIAIDFTVQRDHRAAQGLDQLRSDHPGHAVAAVDHHAHGFGHGDVIADLVEVVRSSTSTCSTVPTPLIRSLLSMRAFSA